MPKKKEKIKKICEVCGKEFEILKCREYTAMFCSVKCKGKAKRRNKKICEVCGNEFYGRKYSIFCSSECSHNVQKKDKIKKICDECGSSFEVFESGSDRKFCSKQCYNKNKDSKVSVGVLRRFLND